MSTQLNTSSNHISDDTGRHKTPFRYNHVALRDLYEGCPDLFAGGRPTFFACVYYPIAVLELDIVEATSEEFDTVEHAILELMAAGIQGSSEIADLLGLPTNFVRSIASVLAGYGHIEDGQVTALGMQSIGDGVKYTRHHIRQKVQVDTLTGTLLPRDLVQPNSVLLTAEETENRITHMMPNPILSSDVLHPFLGDLARFKHIRNSVLHTNVEQIEGVHSQEIRYAYSFLVQFEHLSHPLVILRSRQHGGSKPDFSWRPIAIAPDTSRQVPSLADVPVVEDSYFMPLYQLRDEIMERTQDKTQDTSRLQQALKRDFELEESTGQWRLNQAVLDVYAKPTANARIVEIESRGRREQLYTGLARNDSFPGVIGYVHEG